MPLPCRQVRLVQACVCTIQPVRHSQSFVSPSYLLKKKKNECECSWMVMRWYGCVARHNGEGYKKERGEVMRNSL